MSGKTVDVVAAGLFCARPTPVRGTTIDASEEEVARWDQWRLDVNEIEVKLAATYPWFNRDLFRKACGYDRE